MNPVDNLLHPRFAPPAAGVSFIKRDAALSRLNEGLQRKLAILHAPAGYGKTTVLAQYYERLTERGVGVVCLTLDQSDTAPGKFFGHLVAALKIAGVHLPNLKERYSEDLGEANYRRLLQHLLKQVASTRRSLVLMLDDYSEAESDDTNHIIQHLIEVQPSNLHIVIASRLQPKLPLATLSAHNQIVVVDVDQLRFSVAETDGLLRNMNNTVLEQEDIADLANKTEGWPIALHLVQVWQTEGDVSADHIRQLSGETRELADYLLEQVYDRLDPVQKEFALATSVLTRVNGDIANSLCNRSDCWQILRQFEARGLFLVPLDNRRSWYRYHALFRDFLHQRLAWKGDDRVAHYNIAAGKWLSRHGRPEEAVAHFLAAGEPTLAAATASELGGWRLIWSGQVELLQTVCDAVPDDVVVAYPRLHLGQMYLLGRTGDAQKALQEFERFKKQRDSKSGDDASLEPEIKTVEVVLAGYADKGLTKEKINDLEAVVRDRQLLDVTVLAMVHNYLLLHYLDVCQFDESRSLADQAIAYYRAGRFDFAVGVVRVHVAQSLVAEGRLSDAAVLCDMMLEGDGDLVNETQAVFLVVAAEIAMERNDLGRAADILAETVPFLEDFGSWVNIYTSLYKTAATVARINHGCDAALDVLERARATAAKRSLARLSEAIDLLAVRELVLAGRVDEAAAHAAMSGCLSAGDRGDRLRWQLGETREAIRARLLLAEGDVDAAAEITDGLQTAPTAGACRRHLISNLFLRATVMEQRGDTAACDHALDEALSLASRARFVRVILESGDALVQRLRDASSQPDNPLNRHSIMNRLRREWHGSRPSVAVVAGTKGKSLTQRELDVLKGIGLGYSSKQIAANLTISENTIKHHRKNVYRKLGINNRSEAAALARQMHLTDT